MSLGFSGVRTRVVEVNSYSSAGLEIDVPDGRLPKIVWLSHEIDSVSQVMAAM